MALVQEILAQEWEHSLKPHSPNLWENQNLELLPAPSAIPRAASWKPTLLSKEQINLSHPVVMCGIIRLDNQGKFRVWVDPAPPQDTFIFLSGFRSYMLYTVLLGVRREITVCSLPYKGYC